MTSLGMLWQDVGFIRWPLAFSFLMVAGLAVWSAARLYGEGAAATVGTKAWVDAILFWGGFAFIAGVLGTMIGIVLAAQAIEVAGEVSTTLVWGGVKVAMISSVMGALILMGSSLVWFVLQMRWRLLVAGDTVTAHAPETP